MNNWKCHFKEVQFVIAAKKEMFRATFNQMCMVSENYETLMKYIKENLTTCRDRSYTGMRWPSTVKTSMLPKQTCGFNVHQNPSRVLDTDSKMCI